MNNGQLGVLMFSLLAIAQHGIWVSVFGLLASLAYALLVWDERKSARVSTSRRHTDESKMAPC